ncbi:MAG: MTA/SAH nucleosidase [Thermoanaerobacteraceae bacterium]|nr:MTA/SAH nucleosidase [Thermoanaerobacteraceae bacterium]
MIKKYFFLVFALFFFIALGGVNAGAADIDARPLVVQGAMDLEIQELVKALDNPKEITFGSWTFWQGTIDNLPVVVSRTEVGITNAAAATLLAIEKFHPWAIINQGTSGGHDPSLHRFDIVLGEKAINYGKFKSNHRDYGQGTNPLEWIPEDVTLSLDGKRISFHGFEGDQELLKIAESVASSYQYGRVVRGVIGTADEWNRELDRIKWAHERLGTSVEEMETASAAQVARAYNIPFLGIRILSNSEPQNENWDPKAGAYCQEYVLQVIKAIAKTKNLQDLTPNFKVFIDGSEVNLKHTPFAINDVVYLPVREVFTRMGGTVAWDNEQRLARVKLGDKDLVIKATSEGLLRDSILYMPVPMIAQSTDYHLILNDYEVRLYR